MMAVVNRLVEVHLAAITKSSFLGGLMLFGGCLPGWSSRALSEWMGAVSGLSGDVWLGSALAGPLKLIVLLEGGPLEQVFIEIAL